MPSSPASRSSATIENVDGLITSLDYGPVGGSPPAPLPSRYRAVGGALAPENIECCIQAAIWPNICCTNAVNAAITLAGPPFAAPDEPNDDGARREIPDGTTRESVSDEGPQVVTGTVFPLAASCNDGWYDGLPVARPGSEALREYIVS